MGLWAPKRVIHHIRLTGQKRYVTEQKWIWPVIVTGDYPKIISSPDLFNLMHYRVSELTVVNEVLRKYIDPEKADAVHKQR